MPDKGARPPGPGLQPIYLIGQLGLTVAIPIVLGAVLGHYLDERYTLGGIATAGGALAGLAAGIGGAIRLLVKEIP